MELRDSRKREAPISGVNINGSPDLAALLKDLYAALGSQDMGHGL